MEAVHFLPVQSIQLHWAGNYGGLSLTERIVPKQLAPGPFLQMFPTTVGHVKHNSEFRHHQADISVQCIRAFIPK